MNALEGAWRLAQRVCDAAEWRDGCCTWTDPAGHPVGADLYAGASGVAWFLGQLGAVSGDDRATRTAAAAARYALELVAEPSPARRGLYTGDLGALWGASVVGALLDEPELIERAQLLVPEVQGRQTASAADGQDLLTGSAGDLLAHVGLAARRGEEMGEPAVRIAEEVAAGADLMPYGAAWAQPVGSGCEGSDSAPQTGRDVGPAHLVGMAHGASGGVRALLEFSVACGSTRYEGTVSDALAFERAWFDSDACGWRDPHTRLPTGPSWCRGSVGIAFTRLQCVQFAPGPRSEADAGAALASVHTALAGLLSSGVRSPRPRRADFSVCHGVMGAVDLLVHASEVLGVDEHRAAAARVVDLGLATAETDGRWTCGTLDGSETVGLLLGLSGIGAACLRVACGGRVPPVGLLAGVAAPDYSTS
jgi:lantibiotic modifying enzyme